MGSLTSTAELAPAPLLGLLASGQQRPPDTLPICNLNEMASLRILHTALD